MRQIRAGMNGVRGIQARFSTDLTQKLNGFVSQWNGKINKLATNVAFMARVSAKRTMRSYRRVIPDRILYNHGGAYSSATGAFTAPLSGTYHFFLKTESYIDKAVCLRLVKEGTRILYLFAQDPKSYLTPRGNAVVHLNRGQRVWVDTDWKDSVVSVWTTFGGFLVRADVV